VLTAIIAVPGRITTSKKPAMFASHPLGRIRPQLKLRSNASTQARNHYQVPGNWLRDILLNGPLGKQHGSTSSSILHCDHGA
jgi:hypothetical protein